MKLMYNINIIKVKELTLKVLKLNFWRLINMKKENGKFVKFGVGSDTVLAFVANSSRDNYHLISYNI